MIRRPPNTTLSDTLFPSTTVFRTNTLLLGYVIFDKISGKAEVEVVREADNILQEKIASGELTLPDGVTYVFAGNYEQQERAAKRLLLIVPMSLLAILLILYFQFRTISASLIHFSGVFLALADRNSV